MLLRNALALGALAFASLTPCGRARAHGEPPTPYAVVAHDAQGAVVVRISAGLALRRSAERYQYICPAAWGDEYAAPAAALDDGTVVLGAANRLVLLDSEGRVLPHPDPAAEGPSTEVVRGRQGVFALRNTQHGAELLAIDARSVRAVWSDTRSWYSLAASGDDLVLLRANGTTVEQLTLSPAGAERDRQSATTSTPVDYVFARGSGDASYALLLFQSSRQLGALRMNAFEVLAQGVSSIAGPLRNGSDTLLANDGRFSRLVDGAPVELGEPAYVACLERAGALAYACTRDSIAALDGAALGKTLFQLDWLTTPDLTSLEAGKARDRCDYQWQDLRFDLLALGTALKQDLERDAGDAPSAPAEPTEAGVEDAGEGREGGGAEGADAGRARRVADGCSVRAAARTHARGWGWLALGPLVAYGLRQRRRLR